MRALALSCLLWHAGAVSVRDAVSTMYAEGSFDPYRISVTAGGGSNSSFDGVYRQGKWRSAGDNCFSGWSHPRKVRSTLDTLATVIDEYGITSMVDLPCGDLCFMSSFLRAVLQVKPAFRYHGIDRVGFVVDHHLAHYQPPVGYCVGCNITFSAMDARVHRPPQADLLFSRTMMQHMCTRDAVRILRHLERSGARYLLLTTYGTLDNAQGPQLPCDDHVSTATDHQQQNLSAPPFSLPPPLRLFSEGLPPALQALDRGKHLYLGLWDARGLAHRPDQKA